MNLRDMEYLVAVAELRNFSQAAAKCNVSQPTLSAQIKKLEEWLGVPIFERNNKRVMPTEVGERIILSARRILREAEHIKQTADTARDPLAGNFRLGAFPTVSTYIFPHLVPNLTAQLPQLRLILIEEKTATLLERLKQGEIDAAILALPIEDDQLQTQALFDDEFYLAVPPGHALANKKEVQQSELSAHRLLLLEEGHCLRDQALSVCQLHGLSEEQDVRATGLETLRQMVKAGTGITFMPKIAMHADDPGIRYIPFAQPVPHRTIGLVWRKTTTRRRVIEEITHLLQR
jgi:LysR family hydrogen peroxide-inducible transcriptional activator